jgi:NADPH:quinone reductase-like Zn-dependent oxidoreductase
VFDLVAGETQDRSWAVLREGGIIVSTLKEPDKGQAAAHKARSAPSYTAQPNAAQLKEIADLIEAGKVKVVVSDTFPIDEIRAAHERLENGGVRGKIVLTVA